MSIPPSLIPHLVSMSQTPTTPQNGPTSRGRGRGRGTSRGGLGKYLRASGRGRGRGRPAEFTQRLLIDGEGKPDLTEEEAAEVEKELREKYGRRRLGTNADRYKEEEVELGSDGEPIVEPEVDLASFLEKQRISDGIGPTSRLLEEKEEDQDDMSVYLDLNSLKGRTIPSSKKGNIQQIEWSEELEELNQEKNAADAARDMKGRFKAKSEKLRTKPIIPSSSKRVKPKGLKEAPPLPLPGGAQPKSKTQMEEMEDFLDELLG